MPFQGSLKAFQRSVKSLPMAFIRPLEGCFLKASPQACRMWCGTGVVGQGSWDKGRGMGPGTGVVGQGSWDISYVKLVGCGV